MKLHKVLAINGAPIALVKEDVLLDASSPGRANFTVQSSAPFKGLVTLDIGYNQSTLQRHFIGYIERCTASNAVEQVLFCRELAAVLANPLPMNLRHVDLRAVLAEISEQTGLRFRVPHRPYANVKAPYFYSLAAGYQAMNSLARVFGIPTSPGINRATVKCSWGAGPTAFSASGHRYKSPRSCSTATRATKARWSRPFQDFDQVQRSTTASASPAWHSPMTRWPSDGRRNPPQRRAAIP